MVSGFLVETDKHFLDLGSRTNFEYRFYRNAKKIMKKAILMNASPDRSGIPRVIARIPIAIGR
jgi:hypothetical protein